MFGRKHGLALFICYDSAKSVHHPVPTKECVALSLWKMQRNPARADMADTLAMMEDKENLAPAKAAEMLSESSLSPKKPAGGRKGRSKSIGPGGLNERAENLMKDSRQEAKNRRKSAYVPNTKAIISADAEKAARQAARRKTLGL